MCVVISSIVLLQSLIALIKRTLPFNVIAINCIYRAVGANNARDAFCRFVAVVVVCSGAGWLYNTFVWHMVN